MSLAIRTVRNVAWRLSSGSFRILVTIVTAPYIVSRLGDTEYGLLVTLSAFVGYFAALDLDLATAVSKYTAECSSAGKPAEAKRVVSTALGIFVVLGVTLALSVSLSSQWIVAAFVGVNEPAHDAAQLILVLFGCCFTFSLISWVYGGVLSGLHRSDMLSWVSFVQVPIHYGTIMWLLHAGHGLLEVAVFQAVEPFFVMAAFFLLARSVSPSAASMPAYHHSTAKMLLGFSVVTMAGKLARAATRRGDRILIAAMIAPAAVTPFAVASMPALFLNRMTALFEQLTVPLASELRAVNQDTLGRLYLRATRLTVLASILAGVPLLVFSRDLLNVWMGPDYAESGTLVMRTAVVGSLAVNATSIGGSVLVGSGAPAPYSIGRIVTATVVIALYVALIPRWGIDGAALGFAVPNAVFAVLFTAYLLRRLSLGTADVLRSTLTPLGMLVLAGLGAGWLTRFFVGPASDWSTLTLAMVINVLLLLTLAVLLGVLKSEDYSSFEQAFRVPRAVPQRLNMKQSAGIRGDVGVHNHSSKWGAR